MPSTANTSRRSASATASREDSIPVPTVTTRSTPASRARRSSADGRSAHASRCACVSIKRPRPEGRRAGRAAQRPRCPRRTAHDLAQRDPRRDRRAAAARRGSARRSREIRRDGHGDRTQAVGQLVQGLSSSSTRDSSLRSPTASLLDMPVQPADDVPDRIERPSEVVLVELSRNVVADSRDGVRDHARASVGATSFPSRDRAISAVVLESRFPRSLPSSRSYRPWSPRRRRSRPDRTAPPETGSTAARRLRGFDQVERLDDIAGRLRDLLLVDREVPVDEELLGPGSPRRAARRARTRSGSEGCPSRAGDGPRARNADQVSPSRAYERALR